MKTLVIHPKDETTDFLSVIYEGKDWTVIRDGQTSPQTIKDELKNHDRIIMLGHGTEQGLLTMMGYIISPSLVYILKDKLCVGIWCNADKFFKKYELKGFYTGMFVSELDEANWFCEPPYFQEDIVESNSLFTKIVADHIDSDDLCERVITGYNGDNHIIDYNKVRIFENEYKLK